MVKVDSLSGEIMSEEPESLIDDFEIIACPESLSSMDSTRSAATAVPRSPLQSEVTFTELFGRFQTLFNENMELKETVRQNNMAMRQQCEMLAHWQERGRHLHEEHQKRHSQAVRLISKLQRENKQLRAQGQEAKSPEDEAISGITFDDLKISGEAKQNKSDTEYVTQLRCENERLRAQKFTLEEDVKLLKTDLENMNGKMDGLMNEKWELVAANTDMHSRLQCQQNLSFSELNRNNSMEELYQIERSNAEALRREIREEKAKNEVLDAHVKRLRESQAASLEHQSQQVYHCLCNSQTCIDSVCVALNRYQDRCSAVTEFMNRSLEKISTDLNNMGNKELVSLACQLQNDIQNFLAIIKQEQVNGTDDRKKLEDSHSHLEKLLSHYKKIREMCQAIEEGSQSKDSQSDAYHELASRGFKEQIDSLTAKLLHTDQVITNKDKEVDKLQKTVESLKKDVETISILKVQVDMYRADFQAEREARQNIAGEKDKLNEELQQVRAEKQQVQDELQVLQEQHYNAAAAPLPESADTGDANAGGATGTSEGKVWGKVSPEPPQKEGSQEKENPIAAKETKKEVQRYTCPKCNDWFRTLSAVQNHVEECLDRDMWPQ